MANSSLVSDGVTSTLRSSKPLGFFITPNNTQLPVFTKDQREELEELCKVLGYIWKDNESYTAE